MTFCNVWWWDRAPSDEHDVVDSTVGRPRGESRARKPVRGDKVFFRTLSCPLTADTRFRTEAYQFLIQACSLNPPPPSDLTPL